jgi:hypothetical protein
MKNVILILVISLSSLLAKAQTDPGLFVGNVEEYPKDMVTYTLDENGDTVVNILNYTCMIVADRTFKNDKEKKKWDKLKRDVQKAYPYAVLARMKLSEMDAQLANIKGEKERKAFNEKCEKELIDQFEKDMRQLTMSQGKILMKLLDRETGSTTYQIIKERRGTFSAFMWQSVAIVFGNDLKDDYDPEGDDAKIEEIVQLIELGLI